MQYYYNFKFYIFIMPEAWFVKLISFMDGITLYHKCNAWELEGYCEFVKCFFLQPNEDMKKSIKSVQLVQFDLMFALFEFINAAKNKYKAEPETTENINEKGYLSGISTRKLQICLKECHAIARKNLVLEPKSNPIYLSLCQELIRYDLQTKLPELKQREAALRGPTSELGHLLLYQELEKYNLQTKSPEIDKENEELEAQCLELKAQLKASPMRLSSAEKLLLQYNAYTKVCEKLQHAGKKDNVMSTVNSIIMARDKMQISFINFLMLINNTFDVIGVLKYIDFLAPEYFEFRKLVKYIDYLTDCTPSAFKLYLGLDHAAVQEKIANFIDKITIEHILGIQRAIYAEQTTSAESSSEDILKKFIIKAYTFEQLVLFWHKPKKARVNKMVINKKHIDCVQYLFLEVISHRIKHSDRIDSIINLYATSPNVVIDLLRNIDHESFLCMSYYLLHTLKEGKIFDDIKENVKKSFYDITIKCIENLAPEYILKLLHDEDYYAFAHNLSYETISKIFHIFNNLSEYIDGDFDKLYNIKDVLSDGSRFKFFSALSEGIQEGILLDKSQKLKDLIERETKKYKSDEAKLEVAKVKILQGETDVSCDDEADKEKRECASPPLDNACSKLNTSALNESEGQKYKSDESRLVVDSVEALHGAVGASCNDGENIEKIDSSLSVENDDMVFVEKFFGLDIFRM